MKRDLYFSKPIMNAAGTLGFAPDSRAPIAWDDFGAFVTNPLSLRPRTAAAQPALIEFPGGFLMHSGLPNPGFDAALKKYARRWFNSALPVIVHLMADRPEETQPMVEKLENVENVMAVELGFAPLLADDIILLALEMCIGELPLIFSLPSEQVLSLGPRLIESGAAAISLASPRGAINNNDGKIVEGRLYGQSLFPQTLGMISSAAKIGIPIIGAGGVYTQSDAQALLTAGALAVQMDAGLWLPSE
jgi:dihydroorotate dehydrogenase (NAD+) catalytic subunit